jgi:hypothetical protein
MKDAIPTNLAGQLLPVDLFALNCCQALRQKPNKVVVLTNFSRNLG